VDQLRASDQLRRSLLEHFRCPYPAETSDLKDRRDRCESDFEREMFDLLCERGFRVNTQVRVSASGSTSSWKVTMISGLPSNATAIVTTGQTNGLTT
jgi:hypothetical protein